MPKTIRVGLDRGARLDSDLFPQNWHAIAANDAHDFEVIVFPTGSTRVGFHIEVGLPDVASFANPQIAVHHSSPAVTGDVVIDADVSPIASGESYDPASPTEQVSSGAVTVPGTALQQLRTIITLTGTYTALDALLVSIYLDRADAAYTLADDWHVHQAWFEAD